MKTLSRGFSSLWVNRDSSVNPPHHFVIKDQRGREYYRARDEATVRRWLENYKRNRPPSEAVLRLDVYVEFDKPHFTVGTPRSLEDPNAFHKAIEGFPPERKK